MHILDLPTPALLLDADILKQNLSRMQEKANGLAVSLRPHIKTHKCRSIAEQQRALGARGITVSTLYEAQQFAAAGFDDITWAFPIPLVSIERALQLARRITLRLTVDSEDAVAALEQQAAREDIDIHVWLKTDCGYHRAGVDPRNPASIELARNIHDARHLILDGILTHAGHSYAASSIEDILCVAEQERSVMNDFALRIRSQDIGAPSVSVGSTPTMTLTQNLAGITEIRPGNYCFYDLTMVSLDVCSVANCAVTVLASVVSSRPGTVIIDAGALSLSKDLGAVHRNPRAGFGLIFRDYVQHMLVQPDDACIVGVSQEHGKMAVRDHSAYRIGDRVRILEQHSCLTAASFDYYTVVCGDEVVDRWEILRGRI